MMVPCARRRRQIESSRRDRKADLARMPARAKSSKAKPAKASAKKSATRTSAASKASAKKAAAKRSASKASATKKSTTKASTVRAAAPKTARAKKPTTRAAAGKTASTGKPAAAPVAKPKPKKPAPPPKFDIPAYSQTDIGAEELEFIEALNSYKEQHGRLFPKQTEILHVLKWLGYRKA
jgi:hypothetical protein